MAKTYGLIFTDGDPRNAPATSLAPTLVIFAAINGTAVSTPGVTKPITTVGLYTFDYIPSTAVYFLADGGAAITDSTKRYLSGILDPIQAVDTQVGELSSTLTARHQTLFSIGTTNVALGTTNVALGTTSVALGNTSVALGTQNVAFGGTGLAIGVINVGFGTTNVAIGTTLTGYATSLMAQGVSTYAAALTLLAQTQTISVGVSGIVVNISLNAAAIDEINLKLGTTASAIGSTLTDPGDVFGYLKRLQEFNEGIQNFNKTTGVWSISSRGNTLLASKTLANNSSQVNRS